VADLRLFDSRPFRSWTPPNFLQSLAHRRQGRKLRIGDREGADPAEVGAVPPARERAGFVDEHVHRSTVRFPSRTVISCDLTTVPPPRRGSDRGPGVKPPLSQYPPNASRIHARRPTWARRSVAWTNVICWHGKRPMRDEFGPPSAGRRDAAVAVECDAEGVTSMRGRKPNPKSAAPAKQHDPSKSRALSTGKRAGGGAARRQNLGSEEPLPRDRGATGGPPGRQRTAKEGEGNKTGTKPSRSAGRQTTRAAHRDRMRRTDKGAEQDRQQRKED
jgi:hypothetical protein